MFRTTACTLAVVTLLGITGCSDPASSSASAATPNAESPAEAETVAWVLSEAPAGDVPITEAKASAQEGDQIVVRGRIGGRHAPMAEGSPVFTVVDLALPHCGQNPDDKCPFPWDYCCELPATIASNSATVQVLGDRVDLAAGGLAPLDEVILMGTVGPRPDEAVLTIQATGVYVVSE